MIIYCLYNYIISYIHILCINLYSKYNIIISVYYNISICIYQYIYIYILLYVTLQLLHESMLGHCLPCISGCESQAAQLTHSQTHCFLIAAVLLAVDHVRCAYDDQPKTQ